MKAASEDYPIVNNIVGAGNVGVWTAYDAKRFGVKMSKEVPMTT